MKKEADNYSRENSDEFKEILTRPPHSLIQYGTGIISAALVLLILGGFYFRFPDVVSSRFTANYTENGTYIAQVKLNTELIGKIKPGMEVNLKFDQFPPGEYGVIRGVIQENQRRISDEYLLVDIEIPDNSLSTQQKKLNFESGMTGKADIIIKNIAIIDKIFEPIKNIFAQK